MSHPFPHKPRLRTRFIAHVDALEDRTVPAAFPSSTLVPLGGDTHFVVAGHFDNQPGADFAAGVGNDLLVRLGRANGSFDTGTGIAGVGPFNALVSGNFNGDAFDDVAVVSGNDVLSLTSNGAGGFTHVGTLNLGGSPISFSNPIAIAATQPGMGNGDLSGDGKPDLVYALNGELRILAGDGAGHLSLGDAIDARQYNHLIVRDVDGDGRDDVIASQTVGATIVTATSKIFIYLQTSPGNFQLLGPVDLPTASATAVMDLAVGNFHGDNKLDVGILSVGTEEFGNPRFLTILENTTSGAVSFTLLSAQKLELSGGDSNSVFHVVTLDKNASGFHDVALGGNPSGPTVLATFGTAGGFSPVSPVEKTNLSPGFADALAAGDFNADGKLDLAVAQFGTSQGVSVLFREAPEAPPAPGPNPGGGGGGGGFRILSTLGEPAESPVPAAQALLPIHNKYVVAFIDVDGDLVVIASRKPIFGGDLNRLLRFRKKGKGYQLEKLTLPRDASGTDLRIVAVNSGSLSEVRQLAKFVSDSRSQLLLNSLAPTVLPGLGSGGDSHVNVGAIESPTNLGWVAVDGDLGRVRTGALASLSVDSLGALGLETQGADGSRDSRVWGNLDNLVMSGNIGDVFLHVAGALADANIGGSIVQGHLSTKSGIGILTVGGSIVGGDADYSGGISTSGAIGTVIVKGDLRGGKGGSSGRILADGGMDEVRIKGNVRGFAGRAGEGDHSGRIESEGTIKNLFIGGNLDGESGDFSGSVEAGGMGKVVVRGTLYGGAGWASGFIKSRHNIDNVELGGIEGAEGTYSGRLEALGTLGSGTTGSPKVHIRGDVFGSSGFQSGSIEGQSIRDLDIQGNLEGGRGDWSGVVYAQNDIDVDVFGNVFGGDGTASGCIYSVGGTVSLGLRGGLVGGNGPYSGTVQGHRWNNRLFREGAFPGSGLHSGQVLVDIDVPPRNAQPKLASHAAFQARGQSTVALQGANAIGNSSGNVVSRGGGSVVSRGGGSAISRGGGS